MSPSNEIENHVVYVSFRDFHSFLEPTTVVLNKQSGGMSEKGSLPTKSIAMRAKTKLMPGPQGMAILWPSRNDWWKL